jgi:carotenoid 1,2-hydratase
MRLDAPVGPGGYAWWYVDGMSDDGRHAITLIAFVGSVFSPYYAWARRRGAADPEDHCALNVALYGASGHRWACTERGRGSQTRAPERFDIGPSSIAWDGATLTIAIEEVTVPLPARLRGVVRLRPLALPGRSFALDAEGRHRWRPLAPCARIEVEMEKPALRWSGAGYLDSNDGDEPLEAAFSSWNWSRAPHGDSSVILYDAERRTGGPLSLALRFDATGAVNDMEAPPRAELPRTPWRMARATRGAAARVIETLEDSPFYARSLVATEIEGVPLTAMHESLSLDRFDTGWMRLMLPFRMPRRR